MTRAKDISKIVTDANLSGTLDVTGTVTAGGLTVNGTADVDNLIIDNSGKISSVGQIEFQVDSDNNQSGTYFGFSRNNTTSERIALFQENGDISFYEDTGTTPKFFWDSSAESLTVDGVVTVDRVINATTSSDPWLKGVNGSNTETFFLKPSGQAYFGGNVGIGTSSPTELLEVHGDTPSIKLRDTSAYSAETGPAISFQGKDNGESIREFGRIEGISRSSNNGELTFSTRLSGTVAERVRIDQSGNVGIGTSSPSTPLHVQASGQNANIRLQASDNGYASQLQLYANNVSGASYNAIQSHVNGDGTVQWEISGPKASAEDQMLFSTGGSERMRIDSIGRVMIAETSNSGYSNNADDLIVGDNGASTERGISLGSTTGASIRFNDGADAGSIEYVHSSNHMLFATNGSEAMRIDSNGSLLLGTTDEIIWTDASGEGIVLYRGEAFQVARNSDSCVQLNRQGTDGQIQAFAKSGTQVGNISVTGSATAFNTSSDHRLKENVTADWDATTRLKQLNPVRFNFIADADTTVDGFLAHEVQSVVPEAITGTHNEVDADGNAVMQGIDQSKLVPLLVKTIQELEARIVALETA